MLILLLLLIMVGAIAASPFGILFSNENSTPDAVPISAAIAQVNYDFNAQLEALQGADTYDDVTIAGEMADWVDVLAIFAVKTAGSNDVDATDVVTMDADRVNRLKVVFSDMNIITSTVETIHHADSDPDDDTDDSWTEKILHITITGKTVAEMETEYGFTAQQMTAVDELLAQRDMLEELGFEIDEFGENTVLLRQIPMDLSPDDAAQAVEALAADLLVGRREHKDTVRDELLHTVACKAAIKAGWVSDEQELYAIAKAVMAREDLKYCPHGRPICVSLSKKQLEKQFKRT